MSKSRGGKIVVEFNRPLVGDVTGFLPEPVDSEMVIPKGAITASGQYSSTYSPDKAFDNDTSTYWQIRTSGNQWIQIELDSGTVSNGFSWYVSSYCPNGFIVQGSNDGSDWDDIFTGNSPNETGWHEFTWEWTEPYKFYRWTVTSRHSSARIYIYEIKLSMGKGNESAFTIKGMEKEPLRHGDLKEREYAVESVERYPIKKYWEDEFDGDMEGVEVTGAGIGLEGGIGGAVGAYPSPSTYTVTIPTTQIPDSDTRLKFESIIPDDTNITALYACTDSDIDIPEVWTEVENNNVLSLDNDYLWLQFVLETTDESETPIIQSVWLEEANAPMNKILLTMDAFEHFNNAEGEMTVFYDSDIGNLTGLMPVESFEKSFIPEELEPTPAFEHTITGVISAEVDLVGLVYIDSSHTETITGAIDAEIDFIELQYANLCHTETITGAISVEVDLSSVT